MPPLSTIMARVRSWESASPQEKAQYASKPPAPVAPPPSFPGRMQPDDYAANLHRTVAANLRGIGVDPSILGDEPAPVARSGNTYRLPGMGAAGFPEIRQAAPKQDEGGGFLDKIGGALSDIGSLAKSGLGYPVGLTSIGQLAADARDAAGSVSGVTHDVGRSVVGLEMQNIGSALDSVRHPSWSTPADLAALGNPATVPRNAAEMLAHGDNPYESGQGTFQRFQANPAVPVGLKAYTEAASDPLVYAGGFGSAGAARGAIGFAAGSGIGAQLGQDAPEWAQGPIALGSGVAGATLAHNPGLALAPVRAGVKLNEAINERIPTAERTAESFAPHRGAVDEAGQPLTHQPLMGGAVDDFASPEERANLVKALRDAGISDAELIKEGLIEKPAAGGRSSSPPSAPAPAMSAKPAYEPKPFDIPGQPAGAVAAEGGAAASRAALDFAQGEHSLRLGENVAGAEIGQGRTAQVGAYRAAFQDALNRGATPQEAGAQALEAARGGMRQTFAEGIQAEHFPALEAQAASEYAAGNISDYEHMQIAQDLRDLQAGKKWGLQPAEYRLWQKVFGGEVADKLAATAGGGKAPVWAAKNPATTMPMDLGDQTVAVQPPMFGESGIVEPDSGQYLAEQAGTGPREIQPRLSDNPAASALRLQGQPSQPSILNSQPESGRYLGVQAGTGPREIQPRLTNNPAAPALALGDQALRTPEGAVATPESGQYLSAQAGTGAREIQPRLSDNPDAPALGLDAQHPLTADEIANPQRGRTNPFSSALTNTSDALREIATFGHAGIIGLHGFARMLTNPEAWAEEIAALPKAWKNPAYVQQAEQAGRQAMEEQQAGLTSLMERAGLRIAGPNTGELGGSILRKIPGVGNALRRNEAGYTAVTTAFRRGKAMELVRLQQDANEAAGLPRAITQAQANQIANYTNHFTLTTTSTSNPLLNAILWTPKMLGAQVGLLRDVAGKGPIGLQARKDFAQILGETVTSVFAANLAASGGKDLWGPGLGHDVPQDRDELRRLVGDSSFGKVQIGDQKFSPFGPFDAQVRTAFKVSADVAKGDPTAVQGDAGQWFRNHMSPIMSLATDLITGKDWRGEDVSPASLAKGHLLPIASQQGADLVDNLIHGNAQNSLGDTLGLALSAKSSPVTAADQLDELAQRQFGKNFFNIEPYQQDQVKQSHADLWKAAVDAGNTQRQQSIAKKAELATQQDAANSELLSGKITPKDFANQTHDRKMQLLGAESIIYGDKRIKPPADPAKFDAFIAAGQTPRDRLFRAIDVNTGADGQPDWDKVDAWKAQQSVADQAYIDRNTGLGGTLLERLRSKLSAEYYAIPIYRGYTADQGRAIDTLVTDAKARAKGGRSQAPDDTQVLSAMRQLAKERGIAESSPDFVAARRAVLGILSDDPSRASYRKAHPELALVNGQAALTPLQVQAIRKRMGTQ